MFHALLADLVVALHGLFIVFALLGGLLVLWRRYCWWLHVPALLWAGAVQAFGLVCPLTWLENRLLRAAGEAGYEGGFLAHYLIPLIYPENLTLGNSSDELRWISLVVLLAVNAAVYIAVVRRSLRRPIMRG